MFSDSVFFERTPAILQIIDDAGQLVVVSDRWSEVMGYGREQVIHQSWQGFLTPAAWATVSAALWMQDPLQPIQDLPIQVCTATGQTMAVYASANPVRDEVASRTYWIVVLTPKGEPSDGLKQRSPLVLEPSVDKTTDANPDPTANPWLPLIAATIEDALWLDDPNSCCPVYTSPKFETVWGVPVATIQNGFAALVETVHPEDRDRFCTWKNGTFTQSTPSGIEFRLQEREGNIRWLHEQCFPVFDTVGRLALVIGVTSDITARKQTENALRQYERMISAAPDPICLIDGSYTYRVVNRAFNRWFSPRKDLHNVAVVEAVGPAFFAEVAKPRIDKALAGETQYFAEWADTAFRADAEFVSTTYAPCYDADGKIVGVINSVRNVTTLKRTRNRLKLATDQLQLHVASSPLAVIEWNREMRIHSWSCQAAALFGWSSEEVEGKHYSEFPLFLPEDLPQIEAYAARIQEGQQHDCFWFIRSYNQQEVLIYCEWYNSVQLDQDGHLISVLSQVHDVTQRWHVQTALKESQERWQLALQGSGVGIWDWKLQTNEVFLSARWKEMLGYADCELINAYSTWIDLLHPDDVSHTLTRLEAHLHRHVPDYSAEFRMRCKSGHYKWILARGKAIFDPQGRPVRIVGSHNDISDRKRIEAELRDRLHLQQLLSRISTQFVDMPSEAIAQGIVQALQDIGQTIHAERGCMVLLSDDFQEGHVYHEWHLRSLDSLSKSCQGIVVKFCSWWMEQLSRRRLIVVNSVQDLPSAAKNERFMMQSLGIRSIAAIPMFYSHTLIGYIGFSTETWSGDWTQDDLSLLQLVGDLFANAYQRQHTDDVLKRQERYFRALTEQSSDIVVLVDENGYFRYVAPSAVRILGYHPEEVVGQPVFNFVAPEDVAPIQRVIQEAELKSPTEQPIVQYRVRHKDGSWRDFEAIATSLISDPIIQGIVVNCRDITARKEAEQALKHSEALNRAIIASLPDMLIHMRRDGLCLGMSCPPQFPVVTGHINGVGHNMADVLPADLVNERLTIAARALATRQTQITEYQIDINGELQWEESRIVPLTDNEVLVLVRNIHQRKQAEQEIYRLNAQLARQNQDLEDLVSQRTADLATFMNALPDQIFVVDRATNLHTFGNDAARQFEWPEHSQHFLGKTVFDYFSDEQAALYHAQNQQVFQSGEIFHAEETLSTATGVVHLDTYKIPLKRPNGEVYALIGTSRDVTELVHIRQALEAQTIQLEAANQELQAFTYSVSHDLRAPLRHIEGFIEALRQHLESTVETDATATQYIEVITKSSRKMASLIDGLRRC